MPAKKPRKPKDTDQRLKFLLASTESLHDSVGQLYDIAANHTKQIAEHTKQLQLWLAFQQQRQARFDRTLRAALSAWLSPNGSEGQEEQP